MTVAGYVEKLETVTIPQKISVASLTVKKLDDAFALLDRPLGNGYNHRRVHTIPVWQQRQ